MKIQRTSIFCIPILLSLLMLPATVPADTARDRFFLMGDGKIHIRNDHNGREVRANLLARDNSMDDEGFSGVDEVFGFPTEEKGEHISPRLLFMLDYFSDLVAPGKMIHLTSGYRSPDYNANLRSNGGNVARTSQHLDGMALDFYIDGVNGKELWETVKSKDCCGVGHYGGTTIHLDSARPRFWEAATSKVKTTESERNRRIYLSTDYDRYKPGDTLRLSFSSVSDFGFGIRPVVVFVRDSEKDKAIATARLQPAGSLDCTMIPDRKASRFITLTVPSDLSAGKYRIKVDFCRRPSEQMPVSTFSNVIELFGHTR